MTLRWQRGLLKMRASQQKAAKTAQRQPLFPTAPSSQVSGRRPEPITYAREPCGSCYDGREHQGHPRQRPCPLHKDNALQKTPSTSFDVVQLRGDVLGPVGGLVGALNGTGGGGGGGCDGGGGRGGCCSIRAWILLLPSALKRDADITLVGQKSWFSSSPRGPSTWDLSFIKHLSDKKNCEFQDDTGVREAPTIRHLVHGGDQHKGTVAGEEGALRNAAPDQPHRWDWTGQAGPRCLHPYAIAGTRLQATDTPHVPTPATPVPRLLDLDAAAEFLQHILPGVVVNDEHTVLLVWPLVPLEHSHGWLISVSPCKWGAQRCPFRQAFPHDLALQPHPRTLLASCQTLEPLRAGI
ncbi:hypothetical protein Cadr_000000045 [Camelus dromedarius]|uniref:Uncharacterized protein n=1 Tax=Camelus dromedarius TaxID=9838 RepID=A0A5N4EJ02_CAMDR|nr:hypothetical protein Cadr_000000045 [Camelus dromedarius]